MEKNVTLHDARAAAAADPAEMMSVGAACAKWLREHGCTGPRHGGRIAKRVPEA